MKKSHVYILIHSNNKMLKIGKANELKDRILQLQNVWGKVGS